MRPENLWDNYHAHVYFDEASAAQAEQLCVDAWLACHIGIGRFQRRPVGPHPMWSCQLTFNKQEFDQLVPWLDEHRNGLTILVHPLTGDALAEHSAHARWLGQAQALNLDLFRTGD